MRKRVKDMKVLVDKRQQRRAKTAFHRDGAKKKKRPSRQMEQINRNISVYDINAVVNTHLNIRLIYDYKGARAEPRTTRTRLPRLHRGGSRTPR